MGFSIPPHCGNKIIGITPLNAVREDTEKIKALRIVFLVGILCFLKPNHGLDFPVALKDVLCGVASDLGFQKINSVC